MPAKSWSSRAYYVFPKAMPYAIWSSCTLTKLFFIINGDFMSILIWPSCVLVKTLASHDQLFFFYSNIYHIHQPQLRAGQHMNFSKLFFIIATPSPTCQDEPWLVCGKFSSSIVLSYGNAELRVIHVVSFFMLNCSLYIYIQQCHVH